MNNWSVFICLSLFSYIFSRNELACHHTINYKPLSRYPIDAWWHMYVSNNSVYKLVNMLGRMITASTIVILFTNWWRISAASMLSNALLRLLVSNALGPGQNGLHFPDEIFKCIFVNENIWILIKVSLNFVPYGKINNISALVQIMAWRRPSDKPLSEPMMAEFTDACMRHSVSMR